MKDHEHSYLNTRHIKHIRKTLGNGEITVASNPLYQEAIQLCRHLLPAECVWQQAEAYIACLLEKIVEMLLEHKEITITAKMICCFCPVANCSSRASSIKKLN